MYVERVKSRQGGKVYTQILLRESYRERGENGSKVKKRTLLNLTKYPEAVIQAGFSSFQVEFAYDRGFGMGRDNDAAQSRKPRIAFSSPALRTLRWQPLLEMPLYPDWGYPMKQHVVFLSFCRFVWV
jgi:hypothetical protein